jgi:hypothetical protein
VEYESQEISRKYRLIFNRGEALWDDPIPPEITSNVTGMRVNKTINRASLLAWSLMNVSEVEVADLAFDGWMKIFIRTRASFDEPAFKREVGGVVNEVKRRRSARGDCGAPVAGAHPTLRPSAFPVQDIHAAC